VQESPKASSQKGGGSPAIAASRAGWPRAAGACRPPVVAGARKGDTVGWSIFKKKMFKICSIQHSLKNIDKLSDLTFFCKIYFINVDKMLSQHF
jgi:hypothetical protein